MNGMYVYIYIYDVYTYSYKTLEYSKWYMNMYA